MLHGNRSSSGIYDMAAGYFCNCSGNGWRRNANGLEGDWIWHFRTLVWNMVPGRMAQSGTKDQGEIALERQPVEAYPAIGKKMLFEMQ